MSNPLINWILSETTPQSLSRGKDYRDGVNTLKEIEPGHWKAVIMGSELYRLELLHLGHHKFEATCSCPYEMSGLCKHIVAMAYNIAETNDFAVPHEKMAETKPAAFSIPKENFYDSFFAIQNETIKSDFLRQLFTKEALLRDQFLMFAIQTKTDANQNPIPKVDLAFENYTVDISKLVTEISNEISALALDNDNYYESNNSYINHYDDYGDSDHQEEWAIQEIENVLTPYKNKIDNCLQSNNLSAALDIYIALYLVSLECEDIESELLVEQLDSIVMETIQDYRSDIIAFIQKSIFSDATLRHHNDYLLNFWQGTKAQIHIDAIAPFLIVLNEKSTIAKPTLDFIKERGLVFAGTSDLCFHLAEKTEDTNFWFSVALQFYQEDSRVAMRYLNRLRAEKSVQRFHTELYTVWKKHTNCHHELSNEYKKDVVFEQNPKAYLTIWEYVATFERSLSIYQDLCEYWTLSQKNIFIASQERYGNTYFAQLLKHEKRHDRLLDFVRGQNGSYGGGRYNLLEFIGDIYPEEAITLFKQMLEKSEKSMKMDRSGYASFCANLRCLNTINVEQSEKQQIIERLRLRHTSRRAFLDELQKAAKSVGLK